MRNQLISALQELIRMVLLAVIMVIIEGLATGTFGAIDWNGVLVAGSLAGLRAIDKFLHELDVSTPLDVRFLDNFKVGIGSQP